MVLMGKANVAVKKASITMRCYSPSSFWEKKKDRFAERAKSKEQRAEKIENRE